MSGEQAPEHREVYAKHADRYERLISHEDYESNIARALNQIGSFEAADVVELGAGTGRLARLLAPSVNSVLALDASLNMLQVAAEKLTQLGTRNWGVAAADHRTLPIANQTADVVISGWSIVYLVVWSEDHWEGELTKGLAEMKRIVRPGGQLIILETLGTGHVAPQPPDNLLEYYDYLERQGFSSSWIRTDYRFRSLEEAKEVVGFFFGEAMLDLIVSDGAVTLPECTGIWQLKVGH